MLHIWRRFSPMLGTYLRLGFEASYCINVVTRFVTLPWRRSLPDFYIVGFPKCGTTTLAEYLKLHPGIDGLAGLPYHEVLAKESHFFTGQQAGSAEPCSYYLEVALWLARQMLSDVHRRLPTADGNKRCCSVVGVGCSCAHGGCASLLLLLPTLQASWVAALPLLAGRTGPSSPPCSAAGGPRWCCGWTSGCALTPARCTPVCLLLLSALRA